LIVVEDNFLQPVVVEVVVWLFAVPRFIATGTTGAATTAATATFAAFFGLTRFVPRILPIYRRFGRRFVTRPFAFVSGTLAFFATTTSAAAATTAPPSSRPSFIVPFAVRFLFGIAAAIFQRKLDRFRLPRLTHVGRVVRQLPRRLASPVAAVRCNLRLAFPFVNARALGNFVGLLIGGAEDLVPQAYAEARRRYRLGRFHRDGSGGDFFHRLFGTQRFLFLARPPAAFLPGPFLAGAFFT
jgi:hypothetical protein